MKFKIGDTAYIEWVGIRKVQIIKLFLNTNRYQVLQDDWKRIVKESDLYASEEDFWLKQIERSKKIIERESYEITKAELIIKKLNEMKS